MTWQELYILLDLSFMPVILYALHISARKEAFTAIEESPHLEQKYEDTVWIQIIEALTVGAVSLVLFPLLLLVFFFKFDELYDGYMEIIIESNTK